MGLSVPPLRPRIEIPFRDPAPDFAARIKYTRRGQHLARQDAWEDLGQAICEAEQNRQLSPGLTPVAQWLAEGARSDLVGAALGYVEKGDPVGAQAVLQSLALELEDAPHCGALAFVYAAAQIDIAQAWRGASSLEMLADQRRAAFDTHMQVARNLVDQHDPFERDSPLWASVRCAVIETDPAPTQRVQDDYEDLIELDPFNPNNLIKLGRDLMPVRYGSWEMLDTQARRMTSICGDVWGTGAYAWVYIGALSESRGAIRRMDPELFVEGLHEILDRHRDQHMANRIASFAGLVLARGDLRGPSKGRLADCFGWIVQDHLREVHPYIWADTMNTPRPMAAPIDTEEMLNRGRVRAMSTLAEYYAPALNAGRRLVFGPEGVQMLKGD